MSRVVADSEEMEILLVSSHFDDQVLLVCRIGITDSDVDEVE
jgi:hypothetical protein